MPHALDTKCDWWSYGAILYQMLVGLPPFSHPSVNATNMKIMVADFSFPKSQNNSSAISEDAQDLVYSLLRKSVKKRLDGKQMRRHPFFASVDWSALERKEIKPPTRPIRVCNYETLFGKSKSGFVKKVLLIFLQRTLGPKDDSTSESSSVVSATTTYDSTSRSFVEVES